MLTQQQVSELWQSDDLIALGVEADAIRKQLNPEGIVSYTIAADPSEVSYRFGLGESIEQRFSLLEEIRARQARSGDVASFRPLVAVNATGVEYLKMLALSRLCLDNVPHLIGDSTGFGLKVAQLSLKFGADDLGVAEGKASEEELRRLIRDAGYVPKQRDALFRTYSIA